MTHDRRRSVRLPAGWLAHYALDDRRADSYMCRVVDVSLGGAAFELFGPVPLIGARIHITLRAAADLLADGVEFAAIARNVQAGTGSGVRVGIEWQDVTGPQAALLNLLLKLTYQRAS
jgi:hypothetical protein